MQWPKLSTEQQAEYQLRSSELSSLLPSSAVVPGNTNQPVNKPPSVAAIATPTYTRSSYVCYWDGCGLQFADVAGLFAHVTDLGAGTHIKKEGKKLHPATELHFFNMRYLIFNAHHSNNTCMDSL